ncbi:MAG: DsbE family thiol:disulfide interchange protein [Pseudomonadota bacterium]
MKRFIIPAAFFIAFVGLLAFGLKLDPRHVPSPLVGKPLPAFNLSSLYEPDRTISETSLFGKPRLLNVWASWCAACVTEHPLLVQLSKNSNVEIFGLNYKDDGPRAEAWLRKYSNPYKMVIVDEEGQLGLDLGVYGVPETFVIDRQGIIRYKQVGPLNEEIIQEIILPMLQELS